jgi:hypothetical protein
MKLAMMLLVSTFATPLFSQSPAVRNIKQTDLDVTDGSVRTANGHLWVDAPEMRAILRVPATKLMEVPFTYVGPTEATSKLADGNVRRQFGLKLNAQDACNVLYVMWRISPKSDLVVSMKHNPRMHSSSQCGDGGYRNLKPAKWARVPELQAGSSHILRAEIHNQDLQVSVDGEVMWEGSIPSEAMPFDGPSGLRSDNVRVQFDMLVAR